MKKLAMFVSVIVLPFLATGFTTAQASSVVARVDLSQQRMNVYVNGQHYYSWPVSTARRGYHTPVGTFRPKLLKRMHYSSKYHNSPMPYSVFFHGGYAIHGTRAVRWLGRPASHGCVRLRPSNAAQLFSLIKSYGKTNTRINISW